MNKESQKDMYQEWYELWTKQSKAFFDSANENLQHLFSNHSQLKPEDQFEKMQEWLNQLKQQWQKQAFSSDQKNTAAYWSSTLQMFNEAAEQMLQKWAERQHNNDSIKNVHDLYELWLNCCHEVYQKSLKTSSYQETYTNLMNQALQYWKNFIPKNK
jgi:hypothetical protein